MEIYPQNCKKSLKIGGKSEEMEKKKELKCPNCGEPLANGGFVMAETVYSWVHLEYNEPIADDAFHSEPASDTPYFCNACQTSFAEFSE